LAQKKVHSNCSYSSHLQAKKENSPLFYIIQNVPITNTLPDFLLLYFLKIRRYEKFNVIQFKHLAFEKIL